MPEYTQPKVTITGADDGVKPERLTELSRRYPFVEWGVLVSPKRFGTPRYPSRDWILSLEAEIHRTAKDQHVNIAAHLCGEAARETLAGNPTWLTRIELFDRVQLNGYEPGTGAGARVRASLDRGAAAPVARDPRLEGARLPPEIILQVRRGDQLALALDDLRALGIAGSTDGNQWIGSILFDPSGGTGQRVEVWPAQPEPMDGLAVHMGFAGGIGPGNVLDVLRAIGPRPPGMWIDMESGVRDRDDRFDLMKVERVLELVAGEVR